MDIEIIDSESEREMWERLRAQDLTIHWSPSEVAESDLILLNWDAEASRELFLQRLSMHPRAIPILVMSQSIASMEKTAEFVEYLPYPLNVHEFENILSKWKAIIEREYWEKLRTFDKEGAMLKEIIEALPRTGQKYIEALKNAVNVCDRVAVAKQAHGLKSSVSYIGAKRLMSVCGQLENYSSASTQDVLNRNLLIIQKEFSKLMLKAQELSCD